MQMSSLQSQMHPALPPPSSPHATTASVSPPRPLRLDAVKPLSAESSSSAATWSSRLGDVTTPAPVAQRGESAPSFNLLNLLHHLFLHCPHHSINRRNHHHQAAATHLLQPILPAQPKTCCWRQTRRWCRCLPVPMFPSRSPLAPALSAHLLRMLRDETLFCSCRKRMSL